MEKEENILLKALKYFNLGVDFTEEELKQAYLKQKNIIPVDFNSKEVNYNKVNQVYQYYVALYKWSKIKFIEKIYLRDIKLDNILEEGKPKIVSLPENCVAFYNQNKIYQSIVNALLVNVKTNYDLYCYIDMENTKTVEEVDDCFKKFIELNQKDFEKFVSDIMTLVSEGQFYKSNDNNIELDVTKINSVKELLVEVKIIGSEILEKKAMIKAYTSSVKENFKVNIEDGIVVESQKEKNIEVQRKAMNYYAMMHKEKDFTKFLEIYQKAMEYIESQIPQELKKHIG